MKNGDREKEGRHYTVMTNESSTNIELQLKRKYIFILPGLQLH